MYFFFNLLLLEVTMKSTLIQCISASIIFESIYLCYFNVTNYSKQSFVIPSTNGNPEHGLSSECCHTNASYSAYYNLLGR